MRTKVYLVAALSVVALVAIVWWQRTQSADEEAPIRVKNGSIEIETLDGEWKDGNDAWVNQTGKLNAHDLWVKVTSSTGTCRASGKPVHVQYSQPNIKVMFTTGGSFWAHKTRISKGDVTFVDNKHLRAGTAGDGGHITEVRTQGVTCSLAAGSANVEINICSSSKATACQ